MPINHHNCSNVSGLYNGYGTLEPVKCVFASKRRCYGSNGQNQTTKKGCVQNFGNHKLVDQWFWEHSIFQTQIGSEKWAGEALKVIPANYTAMGNPHGKSPVCWLTRCDEFDWRVVPSVHSWLFRYALHQNLDPYAWSICLIHTTITLIHSICQVSCFMFLRKLRVCF